VQVAIFWCWVHFSRVNKSTAICEQASPRPAIQVQFPHIMIPSILTATQGLREEAESLCECFSEPMTSLVSGVGGIVNTDTSET
jgi:hypothetical protein